MNDPTTNAFALLDQAEKRLRARVLNLTDAEIGAVLVDAIDAAEMAEEAEVPRIAAFWNSLLTLVNEERCRRDAIYADAMGDQE